MKKIIYLLSIIASIVGLYSCSTQNSKKDKNILVTEEIIDIPIFDEDSAYKYIAEQVALGPRIPNTKAHILCGNYLVDKLQSFGWTVSSQYFEATGYDNKNLKGRNIIASYNPAQTKRILLAAHWDTRPIADHDPINPKGNLDGANDGASGVAVLLEVARSIKNATIKPTVGIDIILFDLEDYGQPQDSEYPEKENTWCLGSQYWAKNKHVPNYNAYFGILLDMVGGKEAKFYMEGTSMYYAPQINKMVWNYASKLGYDNYFIPQKVDNIIDDHFFINSMAKIPTIDIIEYENSDGNFFAPHWHTQQDNLSNIDKQSLKRVGRVLLYTLYKE